MEGPGRENNSDVPSHGWSVGQWAGSSRMAVALVALVAAACALGTCIPQGREPSFYLDAYDALPGNFICAISLDNLFYSSWFIFLLMLVAVNLVISNWNRFRKLTETADKAPLSEDFTESPASMRFHIPASVENARERIRETLISMGYGTREITAAGGTWLISQKGALRQWGSLVTHLGILFIFLGVLTGHFPGVGYQGFTILSPALNGGTREFRDPAFSLKLIEAGSRSSEEGRPLDYFSTIDVMENGRRVLRKTIRVNDPLEYRGINFYQSTFSMLGFNLLAKDSRGSQHRVFLSMSPGGEAHTDVPEQIGSTGVYASLHVFVGDYNEKNGCPGHSGSYRNPAAVIFVYDGRNMGKEHQEKAAGLISRERHFSFNGLDFSMGDLIPCSGIYYRKDPGVPLVWLGFLVTIIGVCISFYINEKSVTLLFVPGERGESLYLRTGASMENSYDEELGALNTYMEED